MIDEFHIMYMYKKIQAEAATTDIKTLEQLLKKFRKVVAERREEYYREMGEKKAHKLKMKRLQMLLEKMENNHIYPEDLSLKKVNHIRDFKNIVAITFHLSLRRPLVSFSEGVTAILTLRGSPSFSTLGG